MDKPKFSIAERPADKLSQICATLSQEKRKLEQQSEEMVKKIELEKSIDVDFWTQMGAAEQVSLKAHHLERKLSILNMDLDDEDEDDVKKWVQNNKDADSILVKERALKASVEQLEKQAHRMETGNKDEVKHKSLFMQFFINSRLGLNIDNSFGRSRNLQQQFKTELQDSMGTQSPTARSYWWCPVTCKWHPHGFMRDGHLFPARSGDEAMAAIFGPPELDKVIGKPEKGKSELFRAVNGIWWCQDAESRFERGQMCLVPDLKDDATLSEIQAWQDAPVKDYKIKVVRPQAEEMLEDMDPNNKPKRPWNSLNNQKLDFRGKLFRPRARYVYWAYLTTMLSLAYSEKSKRDSRLHQQIARAEVGKVYWGSAGSYVRKHMLLAFVENMGHEYEQLVGANMDMKEGEEVEPSNTAFIHANEDLLEKIRKVKAQDNGDLDEDEDEYEDMYDDEDDDKGS